MRRTTETCPCSVASRNYKNTAVRKTRFSTPYCLWKIITALLKAEYQRVGKRTQLATATGFLPHRNAPEGILAARLVGEAAVATGKPIVRVFFDLENCFPSMHRLVTFECEHLTGICHGVTRCVRTLHQGAQTYVSTAHGLTRPIDTPAGIGQGC